MHKCSMPSIRKLPLFSLPRTAACIFGNTLEDFTSAGQIGEVQVLVLAVFAGGNPAVIGELWPQLKAGPLHNTWDQRMSWKNSGVDGLHDVVCDLYLSISHTLYYLDRYCGLF